MALVFVSSLHSTMPPKPPLRNRGSSRTRSRTRSRSRPPASSWQRLEQVEDRGRSEGTNEACRWATDSSEDSERRRDADSNEARITAFAEKLLWYYHEARYKRWYVKDDLGERRDGIQIFVKTLSGKSIAISVSTYTLIADLKAQVATKLGIPPAAFRLLFANKQLEDLNTVGSYNIQHGNNLHLVLYLRGGHDIYKQAPWERPQDPEPIGPRIQNRLIRCTADCQFCEIYFCFSMDPSPRRCDRPAGHGNRRWPDVDTGDVWHICPRCMQLRASRRDRRRSRTPRRRQRRIAFDEVTVLPDGDQGHDGGDEQRRRDNIEWMRSIADWLLEREELRDY